MRSIPAIPLVLAILPLSASASPGGTPDGYGLVTGFIFLLPLTLVFATMGGLVAWRWPARRRVLLVLGVLNGVLAFLHALLSLGLALIQLGPGLVFAVPALLAGAFAARCVVVGRAQGAIRSRR